MPVIKFGFKSKIVKVGKKVTELVDGYTVEQDPLIKSAMQRFASVMPVMKFLDDYIFIRHRAISAGEFHGPNGNWDYFADEELFKNYPSFINTGFFRDHQNWDKKLAYGINGDSRYNKDGHFIELISAVGWNLQRESKITCENILSGLWDETSMGCEVAESECSVCGNKAHTKDEYCDHIRYCKGSRVNGKDVYEINHGVQFFEDSLITTEAADPQARIVDIWSKEDAEEMLKSASLSKVAYNSRELQRIMEIMISSAAVETGGVTKPEEWIKAFEEEVTKGFQPNEVQSLLDEVKRYGRSKIKQMVASHESKKEGLETLTPPDKGDKVIPMKEE